MAVVIVASPRRLYFEHFKGLYPRSQHWPDLSRFLTYYRLKPLTALPVRQTSPCRPGPGRCCRAPGPWWATDRRGNYRRAPPACDAITELVECVWHFQSHYQIVVQQVCCWENIYFKSKFLDVNRKLSIIF